MTTATYRTAAHHLLQQANAEFQLQDLRQASEKAWGAVAQITKAYAESLSPPAYHRSHGSLKTIARNLAQGTGNPDFLALFNAVERLHVNFYENTRSAGAVQAGMVDAQAYTALFEAQLPQPP